MTKAESIEDEMNALLPAGSRWRWCPLADDTDPEEEAQD